MDWRGFHSLQRGQQGKLQLLVLFPKMLQSHGNFLDLPCSSPSVEEVGAAGFFPLHMSPGPPPHLEQNSMGMFHFTCSWLSKVSYLEKEWLPGQPRAYQSYVFVTLEVRQEAPRWKNICHLAFTLQCMYTSQKEKILRLNKFRHLQQRLSVLRKTITFEPCEVIISLRFSPEKPPISFRR